MSEFITMRTEGAGESLFDDFPKVNGPMAQPGGQNGNTPHPPLPQGLNALEASGRTPIYTHGSTVVDRQTVRFFTVDPDSPLLEGFDGGQDDVARYGDWLAVSRALSSKPNGTSSPDIDAITDYRRREKVINGFSVKEYEDFFVRAFPEADLDESILGNTDDVVIAPNFRALLNQPDVSVYTLQRSGRLAGFSLMMPIDKMDPSRQGETGTAYVYYAAIDPALQGEGLVGVLSQKMMASAKSGGYEFIEADCMIENGYADNVEKTYGDAVVDKFEHNDFGEGPQRFFRIELDKLTPENLLPETEITGRQLAAAREEFALRANRLRSWKLFGLRTYLGRTAYRRAVAEYRAAFDDNVVAHTRGHTEYETDLIERKLEVAEKGRLWQSRHNEWYPKLQPKPLVKPWHPKKKLHRATMSYHVARKTEQIEETLKYISSWVKHFGVTQPDWEDTPHRAQPSFSYVFSRPKPSPVPAAQIVSEVEPQTTSRKGNKIKLPGRRKLAALGAVALVSVAAAAAAWQTGLVGGDRNSKESTKVAKIEGSSALTASFSKFVQLCIIDAKKMAMTDSKPKPVVKADQWQPITNAPDGFWASKDDERGVYEVAVSRQRNSLWSISEAAAQTQTGVAPNLKVVDYIADKTEAALKANGKQSSELEFKQVVEVAEKDIKDAYAKYQTG